MKYFEMEAMVYTQDKTYIVAHGKSIKDILNLGLLQIELASSFIAIIVIHVL